jgi:prophage maintenance system killer protein
VPRWIGQTAAIAIHEWLATEHGGDPSGCDAARLEAVLAGPRELYRAGTTSLFQVAARYALGAARDRPFGDNSTCVALALAGVFLELNGWRLAGTEGDAASVTRALASRELDASAYAMWLEGASRPRPRPLC